MGAEDLNLDILYEDQDVIVVNKPRGMVVHPAKSHTSGTLVNGLVTPFQGFIRHQVAMLGPGIVHRTIRIRQDF